MSDTENTNMAERAEVIRAAVYAQQRLKANKKKLDDEFAEDHKSALKAIGMSMSEFNIVFRYWNFDDEAERDEALDRLRECFVSVGLGGQASFLSVLDDAPAPEPVRTDTGDADLNRDPAYASGVEAYQQDEAPSANPHRLNSKDWKAWKRGWEAAREAERAAKTDPAKADPAQTDAAVH